MVENDNKKKDNLSINIISAPNEVKPVSQGTAGNAKKDPFCIYAGMRHGVGSIIKKDDGSELICTNNGSWQNKE